jgi:hypothetical protein
MLGGFSRALSPPNDLSNSKPKWDLSSSSGREGVNALFLSLLREVAFIRPSMVLRWLPSRLASKAATS